MAIEGLYRGESAFLIGGSARLLELDLSLLRIPGVWTMAINNAATVIEPNAFISLDETSCFDPKIFSNPRILKLANYSRNNELIAGKRVCRYPNTLFFDMKDADSVMISEFCTKEGPLPFWRATFFTALASLYQLGFKEVYLLGCTFDEPKYSHATKLNDEETQINNEVFKESIDVMKRLIPSLKDEGFNVYTCHRDSGLSNICDYHHINHAVGKVAKRSNSVGYIELHHSKRKSAEIPDNSEIQKKLVFCSIVRNLIHQYLKNPAVLHIETENSIKSCLDLFKIETISEFSLDQLRKLDIPFDSIHANDAVVIFDPFLNRNLEEIENLLESLKKFECSVLIGIVKTKSHKLNISPENWMKTLIQIGEVIHIHSEEELEIFLVKK